MCKYCSHKPSRKTLQGLLAPQNRGGMEVSPIAAYKMLSCIREQLMWYYAMIWNKTNKMRTDLIWGFPCNLWSYVQYLEPVVVQDLPQTKPLVWLFLQEMPRHTRCFKRLARPARCKGERRNGSVSHCSPQDAKLHERWQLVWSYASQLCDRICPRPSCWLGFSCRRALSKWQHSVKKDVWDIWFSL